MINQKTSKLDTVFNTVETSVGLVSISCLSAIWCQLAGFWKDTDPTWYAAITAESCIEVLNVTRAIKDGSMPTAKTLSTIGGAIGIAGMATKLLTKDVNVSGIFACCLVFNLCANIDKMGSIIKEKRFSDLPKIIFDSIFGIINPLVFGVITGFGLFSNCHKNTDVNCKKDISWDGGLIIAALSVSLFAFVNYLILLYKATTKTLDTCSDKKCTFFSKRNNESISIDSKVDNSVNKVIINSGKYSTNYYNIK